MPCVGDWFKSSSRHLPREGGERSRPSSSCERGRTGCRRRELVHCRRSRGLQVEATRPKPSTPRLPRRSSDPVPRQGRTSPGSDPVGADCTCPTTDFSYEEHCAGLATRSRARSAISNEDGRRRVDRVNNPSRSEGISGRGLVSQPNHVWATRRHSLRARGSPPILGYQPRNQGNLWSVVQPPSREDLTKLIGQRA
jgi:hypothetical protein